MDKRASGQADKWTRAIFCYCTVVIIIIMSTSFNKRLARACDQAMYLLHVEREQTQEGLVWWTFQVQGASSTTYTINFHAPSEFACTCPDFSRSHNVCKHILFMVFRVTRLDKVVIDAFAESFQETHWGHKRRKNGAFQMLDDAWQRVLRSWFAVNKVETETKDDKDGTDSTDSKDHKDGTEGETCIMCMDDTDLTGCRDLVTHVAAGHCSTFVHRACAQRWWSIHPTCPVCKRDWQDPLALRTHKRKRPAGYETDDCLDKLSVETGAGAGSGVGAVCT